MKTEDLFIIDNAEGKKTLVVKANLVDAVLCGLISFFAAVAAFLLGGWWFVLVGLIAFGLASHTISSIRHPALTISEEGIKQIDLPLIQWSNIKKVKVFNRPGRSKSSIPYTGIAIYTFNAEGKNEIAAKIVNLFDRQGELFPREISLGPPWTEENYEDLLTIIEEFHCDWKKRNSIS